MCELCLPGEALAEELLEGEGGVGRGGPRQEPSQARP